MQNNNNRKNELNQLEILSDKDKKGKERPWETNKLKTLLLAESYKRLGIIKKAYRIKDCGIYLEFKRFIKDNTLKLKGANFCYARLCPMCAWRRSLKIFGQVSKVMNKVMELKDYRFVFLTLTVKNTEGYTLKETLDNMFKSYNKMFQRKQIKSSIKGWFRALEVTHNLNKDSKDYDTYHPHFHIILMVNKSYFTDKRYYISQEKWISLWKESLGVDYDPVVDVRTFKVGSKKQVQKSVAETAKYTVKDNDYLIVDNEELTDSAVQVLDYALARRRLTAFGGLLKEIHKELNLDDAEKGDLVNTDNEEELREDVDYVIVKYQWNIGYNQYVKF